MFNKHGEFPFYKGEPFRLSTPKWILWLVVTVGAFFIFSGTGLESFYKNLTDDKSAMFKDLLVLIVLIITFILILGVFWYVSKGNLNTLFRKIDKKIVFKSILIGLFGLVVIGLYNYFIVEKLMHLKVYNDAALNSFNPIRFIEVVVQLIAEEFWTIVPFLVILTIMHKLTKGNRNVSIITAWILSAVIFALYHLPAYHGNLAQVLLLIMPARLVLTFAYLKYKSIWASYIAHLSYDLPVLLIALIKSIS